MSTTSIHVTLPQALKDHIEKRVAEGEFTSPSDYVRALVRAERAYQEKRAALLGDIDAGLADLEAGRVYDGEAVFAELLGEEEPQHRIWPGSPSPRAPERLRQIHAYIAKDNPAAARCVVERLRARPASSRKLPA
jgi:antitoxin ParD1/3/4